MKPSTRLSQACGRLGSRRSTRWSWPSSLTLSGLLILSILTASRTVALQFPLPRVLTPGRPSTASTTGTASASWLASTSAPDPFRTFHDSTQANMTSLESRLTPELFREIRDVWFAHFDKDDPLVLPTQEQVKVWFQGGKDLDGICIQRFGPTLEAIRASGAKTGEDILKAAQPESPLDWLSLIILLDQISRNCYRGDEATVVFNFFDPLARDVAAAALDRGIPNTVPEIRWRFTKRIWFYLPLMHSEDIKLHERATQGYEQIRTDTEALLDESGDANASEAEDKYRAVAAKVLRQNPEAARKQPEVHISFEKRHMDIIQRFGRYPHRNAALGRATTQEEKDYLENGGDTFGG